MYANTRNKQLTEVDADFIPKSSPFLNDLKTTAVSGKQGGPSMVSRPGKGTISQYLCFSNGSKPTVAYPSGYNETKLPHELL